ncbi:uncharacterized protein LOC134705246 [Mytilus trossulus]|uniref:uncharacterized protein LOC134705246 n=1 Tax=Mytilus trossulus TaxID=6551 RepID=UPI003005F9E0
MQADDEDDSIHASFNVELPFDIPSDVEEDNIADDSVYDDDEDVPAGPVTYTVIDNATQRGKPKLVDNIGFSYTLKREKNGARTWWCSVRNKTTHCGVIVHEKDGVFIPPSIQHNHTAVPGTLTATKIKVTTAYYQKDTVYKFVKNLMALPFLPAEHIPSTFEDIATKAKSARTKELAEYVKNTWLSSTVWLVPSWSIFMRPVRTNNDVEGWHRRINDKAVECNKPFYELLELLHTETTKVPMQVKLISEGKLKRCQRKKVRAVQGKVFALWEQNTTHSITTAELLKQTMRLNGPVPTPENTDQ